MPVGDRRDPVPGQLQKAWRAPDVKQQHVGMHRKYLMRKHMLRFAVDGAAYVPFIGDGDLAVKLYTDRAIYGADLDEDRVATATSRLAGDVRVADCDSWPFPDITAPFAIADFDAYIEPYVSFRSFWSVAEKADRVVVFFTDGRKQGLMRTGWWTTPDGRHLQISKAAKGPIFHAYLNKHIWPWFDDMMAKEGWRIVHRFRYQRDMMVYWSAAVERVR